MKARIGRKVQAVGMSRFYRWFHVDGPEVARSGSTPGERQIFTGSPDAIASDLRAFAAAGVSQLQVIFPGNTTSEMIENMQSFNVRIAPLVRDI
jgi:hypothetical protein